MEIIMSIQADTTVGEITVEQWLAVRMEAGLRIDPETAEVDWRYGAIFDPYEIEPACRRNCGSRVEYTSLVLREATYGFRLIPARRNPRSTMGKA
jgi:hypothetical protein